MDFIFLEWHETRSDNPDLHGYKVHLDGQQYILYYNKDQLREVYFLGRFKNYFMSCRTDFKTISHYYIENIKKPGHTTDGTTGYIRRYEQGTHDRTYVIKGSAVTMCTINNTLRVYTATNNVPKVDRNKVYTDLLAFLAKFYALGLDKLFAPQEPIKE